MDILSRQFIPDTVFTQAVSLEEVCHFETAPIK